MTQRRLIWHLYPSFLFVVVACILITGIIAIREVRLLIEDTTESELGSIAKLFASELHKDNAFADTKLIRQKCNDFADKSGFRITVVKHNGLVLAESDNSKIPKQMDDHANRPEIIKAFAGEKGVSIRFSNTLRKNMMYLAVPIFDENRKLLGACRTAKPLKEIHGVRARMASRILSGGLIAAIIGAGCSLLVSRRMLSPIQEMHRVATRLSRGEFSARLQKASATELNDLAEAMNQMARELSDRIETVTRQRNELDAILAGMNEGLLVIDEKLHIRQMNEAAELLFEQKAENCIGRSLVEVIRNPDLHDLANDIFGGTPPEEREISLLQGAIERHLQVRVARLEQQPDFPSKNGAILVLADVTRLKKLENLRREFAANVSHELRTPVTSIKGFAETLLDGALDNREEAERFLKIIHSQTERLNALIGDLLALARVERQGENGLIRRTRLPIASHVQKAVELFQSKAEQHKLSLEVDCESGLYANINEGLMEQAVANLIDNAIIYSEAGGKITVKTEGDEREVRILVADQGRGIAAEHLDRLFERFYRVDKARSREQGGTGLGLAIVKHVMQVNEGRVEVESKLGEGSTFSLILPRA